MVHKRVRDWTSGRSLPYRFVVYPLPPPAFSLPKDGLGLAVFMLRLTTLRTSSASERKHFTDDFKFVQYKRDAVNWNADMPNLSRNRTRRR